MMMNLAFSRGKKRKLDDDAVDPGVPFPLWGQQNSTQDVPDLEGNVYKVNRKKSGNFFLPGDFRNFVSKRSMISFLPPRFPIFFED